MFKLMAMGAMGWILVGYLICGATPVYAQQYISLEALKSGLKQLPFTLPHMLDEETRLDRIEGGYNEVVYFNTIVNYTYQQIANPTAFFDAIAQGIRKNYCEGDDMSLFRNGHVNLLHLYYDKTGELIGSIKTGLNQCAEERHE